MTTYEIITHRDGSQNIKRTDSNGIESWIPKDEANSDYQTYLRWLNGEEENGTIS